VHDISVFKSSVRTNNDVEGWHTEVDRPSRPTGYIPTPANANFALGSDAVRGKLKVLYPANRWSRGQNPIDRNAMITRKKEILMEVYDTKHFQILRTLLGIV